jgi:hypothetical protein
MPTLTADEINQYAKDVHSACVKAGWWDDPDRCIFQLIQLINSEVSEATEADRKDLMDSHLQHRKGVEVELADALIRLMDLAGRYKWEYKEGLDPHPKLRTAKNLAAKHLWITASICNLAAMCDNNSIFTCANEYTYLCAHSYGCAVKTILVVAEQEGYDLKAAIDEKLAYNKNRADHKRENRAKVGGKKY